MNWRWILIWILLLNNGFAYAQYTSQGGGFEVDQIKGCAPLTITVTLDPVFACDNSNPCAAFYENDSVSVPLITPPFTHTYTQPGIYTLKVLRTPLVDSIQIEVTENNVPQFDLYTCGNNEVSVQLNDSNYDEYIINYNDGSPEITVSGTATHRYIYGSSGTQTVAVRGHDINADDNCDIGETIITPLTSLPQPKIELLEVVDNTSIRLEFDTQPNILYKLGISTNNATTFQQVKTLSDTGADTISNLFTDDNYYCFQLAAFDPCNNTVINSSTVCSANLDLNLRNKAIDVTWNTASGGISSYQLSRANSDGVILNTAPTGSPYVDTGITCGTEYCYQLTSNYPDGSRSVSLLKCGIGFSTDIPTAINNITAVVNDNAVSLEWTTDPNFIPAEFSIEKSVGGNYSLLSTTTQNAFDDVAYNLSDESCYRISYKDACDNQSPQSGEACPIRLSGNLLKDNSISLNWTPYQGWSNGVSGYTIEKYSEDGVLLQTFQIGNTTTYLDDSDDFEHQSFVYIVKAISIEPNLPQAVSNRIAILKDPNIFHPTAFTPNGDNLNDNFTVFGQYIVDFQMQIFNRWGELLFSTDNIQAGWDGTLRGNKMPEGTYTFIAHITDRAGRTFKRSGSVVLIRKGQ